MLVPNFFRFLLTCHRVFAGKAPVSELVFAVGQQHHPANETPNLIPCTQEFVRKTNSSKFPFGKLYFVQSNGDFAKLSTEKLGDLYAQISRLTTWQASRSATRRTLPPTPKGE